DVREPTNQQATYLLTDEYLFIQSLLENNVQLETSRWTTKWNTYNELAQKILTKTGLNGLTEGNTVKHVLNYIPNQSELCIGNRGVSGIDGVVSTALGIAAANAKRVTLVIGDLSFYHDLNGLLAAKHYNIDITIVLINNDGGGIFSFLPQAEEGTYFEKLFGT